MIKNHHNNGVSSPEIESAISSVERIVNYSFRNRSLLEEALTHSSSSSSVAGSPSSLSSSYQRLEFLGDMVLGLAVSSEVFLEYPGVEPGHLSTLRAAIISTENLARVAVRHDLYSFLRRNAPALDEKVRKFAELVRSEDNSVAHGGSVKAPKVLADLVESIAAAIFVDVNFDIGLLWKIFRHLLEPIPVLEELLKQPQPITTLYELCQKNGKQLDIKHWKNESKNVISIHVDGKFIASGSSEQKETAKLNAVKIALCKLDKILPSSSTNGLDKVLSGCDGSSEIVGAKQKLRDLCVIKKWPVPTYKMEEEEGLAHEKKYSSSVQISTVKGVLFMVGEKKSRLRGAENSAASLMIRALRDSDYL